MQHALLRREPDGFGSSAHAGLDDQPPFSRLFLVCGKAADEELLVEAFQPFGRLQSVKLLRDKGVAYVKYDRASSAAAAQEHLHETVLSDGRTKLKVMLAEAPHSRRSSGHRSGTDAEMATDPDNIPPRSRLFIVVPKNADAGLIQEEMAHWPELQYCKTDLIASKGVVFCKFSQSSSALRALESIADNGMLAGYKVKCMLAEPKGKRGRADSGGGSLDTGPAWGQDRGVASPSTSGSRGGEQAMPFRDQRGAYTMAGHGLSPAHSRSFTSGLSEGRSVTPAQSAGFAGLGGLGDHNVQHALGSIAQLGSLAALQGIASLAHANLAQGAALAAASQGLSMAQLQQLSAQSGLTAQQLQQALAQQGLLQHQQPDLQRSQPQQQSSLPLPRSLGVPAQHHNIQQPQQQSQQQHAALGHAHSGGASDGSLNSLAAQVGLGGATGLGLGVGNLAGSALSGRGGLEGLSLGSLIGGVQQGFPPNNRERMDAGHNDMSSAGSMSVCTTSGLRSSEPLNRQRLFVVCHKAVSEEMLARLFRTWPGLEYLDLKRDRATGQSKGFCYVNYSTREAAALAMDTLNGVEWPPASGVRLKVMYAEPLGSRAPGAHRTPPPGSASRPAPSDSLESAAHGLASPIAAAEDETSSRHRPLPTPDDPILPSPLRFPLPTSIAEETDAAAYGAGGFGGLAPGPSRSTDFGHPAVSRPEGAHQRQASNEHLQQAQLQALQEQQQRQQQLQQLQQHQRDVGNAAQGQAHMQQLAYAAAGQATQHRLAQQLVGHGSSTLPAPQGPPQHSGPMHGGGHTPQQAGLDPQVAAVQPPGSESGGKQGRKQAAAAAPTTSDMNWESADAPGAEERRLYTSLERPMPDYALEHVFSRYGAVDFVRLQSNACYGVVQFATAEAAAAALAGLAGTDILGQALTLSATDPLNPERNSKRPRVAP